MEWKMNSRATPSASGSLGSLIIVMGLFSGALLATHSWPAGFKSPEECLAYSGDGHLNCLYAYIEIQKAKISKLEKKLLGQQETTQELQGRLKQQKVRARALERKIEDRTEKSQRNQFPMIRPYGGYYYRFGSPYYYDPYFGPPFGYGYGYSMYYPWW